MSKSIDEFDAIEKLANWESQSGLKKPLTVFNSTNIKQQLKNELFNILKRCQEECNIREEIPNIKVQIRNDVAYFDFFHPVTGEPILLGNDWLLRHVRRKHGR